MRPDLVRYEQLQKADDFAEEVEHFLHTHAPPSSVAQWRAEGVVPKDLWRAAASAGLLGLSIPVQYGGPGLTFAHEAILIEALGRHGLDAFGAALHNSIVIPYILSSGTLEQKQRWLPRMRSGEFIGAIAMTEPGAGSDLRGISTTARREGSDYIISGQKTYISNGQTANLILVFVRMESDIDGGFSIAVMETDNLSGFSRGRNLEKIGLEAADTSELFFGDVRISSDSLLGGAPGAGMAQLMENLPQERLMIALQGAVAIEVAVSELVSWVRSNFASGHRPDQNTLFKLAECKTEAEVTRNFVDRCIDLHLTRQLDPIRAAMAKLWAAEAQGRVIDNCLQLQGEHAFLSDSNLRRLYHDARVQRIYGGTNEIMKLLIGRDI